MTILYCLLAFLAAATGLFAFVLWLGFKCDERIYHEEKWNSDLFT